MWPKCHLILDLTPMFHQPSSLIHVQGPYPPFQPLLQARRETPIFPPPAAASPPGCTCALPSCHQQSSIREGLVSAKLNWDGLAALRPKRRSPRRACVQDMLLTQASISPKPRCSQAGTVGHSNLRDDFHCRPLQNCQFKPGTDPRRRATSGVPGGWRIVEPSWIAMDCQENEQVGSAPLASTLSSLVDAVEVERKRPTASYSQTRGSTWQQEEEGREAAKSQAASALSALVDGDEAVRRRWPIEFEATTPPCHCPAFSALPRIIDPESGLI